MKNQRDGLVVQSFRGTFTGHSPRWNDSNESFRRKAGTIQMNGRNESDESEARGGSVPS